MKTQITIGSSKKIKDVEYIVDELFTADSTRWVRATYLRRKVKVAHEGKRFTYYLIENKYFTEAEWKRS